MEYFQIIGVGIIGALAAITLKNWRPELAAVLAIAVGIIIMLAAASELEGIFGGVRELVYACGLEPEYIKIVVKLTGIAYITKFAADICRDCGETAIAAKVELAGKVTVFAMTVPMVGEFLKLVIETLNTF